MDPNRTIWLDIGCGAPIFLLQGSFFNCRSYGIDYPSVIDAVMQTLEQMNQDAFNLVKKKMSIAGCSVFDLTMKTFPAGLEDVTHVTIMIGLPHGAILLFYC